MRRSAADPSVETFKEHWDFEWQEGYGAFSIGISGVEEATKYIQNQAEHHRKMTFKEEVEAFLKKHGMIMWNKIWSDTQPDRAKENSPPIHRWVTEQKRNESRQGRQKWM